MTTRAPWQDRIVRFERVPPAQLVPNPNNWRRHPEAQRKALAGLLGDVGWVGTVLANITTGHILDGHARHEEAVRRKEPTVPVTWVEISEEDERKVLATFDPIGALAETDNDMLAGLLATIETQDDDLAAFLASLQPDAGAGVQIGAPGSMTDTFGVPPFSVLDARQGYWQDRKRQWIRLGIDSGEGRADDLLMAPEGDSLITQRIRKVGSGTSIFDPVLAELAVRWFCPPAGEVLDPFAGGSVRGTVAALCGRHYTGIDIRPEQVEANRAQWCAMTGTAMTATAQAADNPVALTPVERRGEYWLKRDDEFSVAGVRGGKVRTCHALAQGATGLVTAGSRASPQVNIVAHVARAMGIPCRVHTPQGKLAPEVQAAKEAGAEVIQHKAGYNSVIIARAKEDAAEHGWTEIPFGMECEEAVRQTQRQVDNLPRDAKRLVVPVGSGMSLAGILHGLARHEYQLPVLGVVVGADPTKRLNQYAPKDWKSLVTLVPAGSDYHEPAPVTDLHGVQLDPHYEAKTIPFLEPGDCLWVVGIRQTAVQEQQPKGAPFWVCSDSRAIDSIFTEGQRFDLVFSCPPYADLEVYSDDPADISTMDYRDFMEAYRDIIAKSVARLQDNRFAFWVVGEVRDERGLMRGFVRDTIQAFEDAGARLYNEAVLVTAAGSLPLRAGRMFRAARKLGKGHQNVLVFLKGDHPEPMPIPHVADACAAEFEHRRTMVQSHESVLIFAKGDPAEATKACGQIDMVIPDEQDAA